MANDLPKGPPILSIDFDGVLHSYTSSWKGARNIPDPPIRCAVTGKTSVHWLSDLVPDGDAQGGSFDPRHQEFQVCIFSSRARYWGGRRAMKRWLVKWGFPEHKLENLRFPLWKPPSFLHIDDRALCFRGAFPTVAEMKRFQPFRYNRFGDGKFDFISWIEPAGNVLDGTNKKVTWAEGQPQYIPLATLYSNLTVEQRDTVHGVAKRTVRHRILSRWRPTVEQRQMILEGKDIFLELMTFGAALQPSRMFLGSDVNREEILGLLADECLGGDDSGKQGS